MSIRFACAHCGYKYKVPDELAGKPARCKSCGSSMAIPDASTSPAAPMEQPVRANPLHEALHDAGPRRAPDTFDLAEPPPPPPPPPAARSAKPAAAPKPAKPQPARDGGDVVRAEGGRAMYHGLLLWFCSGVMAWLFTPVPPLRAVFVLGCLAGFFMGIYGLFKFTVGLGRRRDGRLNIAGQTVKWTFIGGVITVLLAIGVGVVTFMYLLAGEVKKRAAATTPDAAVSFANWEDAPVPLAPRRGTPTRFKGGIIRYEATLYGSADIGAPMSVWVYLPAGDHAAASLPAVFIAPSGTPFITGSSLGAGGEPEHLPWAQAGFAVVYYQLDGAPQSDAGEAWVAAVKQFMASGGGAVNARNAVAHVRAAFPEIDPDRLYIAGHSSAATHALHVGRLIPQFKAVIAFAPGFDISSRVEPFFPKKQHEAFHAFCAWADPSSAQTAMGKPVFLFHSTEDRICPVDGTKAYADKLRGLGDDVTWMTGNGDHYSSMIGLGLPQAVHWLKRKDGRVPDQPPPAAEPPAPRVASRANTMTAVKAQPPEDTRSTEMIAADLTNPVRRSGAKEALIARGADAEEAVLRFATHSDFQVRTAAVEVLGKIGTERSVETLQNLAADRYSHVADAAAAALKQIDPEAAAPAILAVMQLKTTESHRRRDALIQLAKLPVDEKHHALVASALEGMAAEVGSFDRDLYLPALMQWKRDETGPILIGMFNRNSSFTNRRKLMEHMAMFQTDAAAEALVGAMRDRMTRGDAAEALTNMGEFAESHVLVLLTDDDPGVRGEAISVLGKIGTAKSASALRRIAGNRNDRTAARQANAAIDAIRERLNAERRREAEEQKALEAEPVATTP